MLNGIDQLSQLDQWDNPDLTSSSTTTDQNLLMNQYMHDTYTPVPSNAYYQSFYPQSQQPPPTPSSCYRCQTIIYGHFVNCVRCNRSCCQVCLQTHFFSHPITCEYCTMQAALAAVKDC